MSILVDEFKSDCLSLITFNFDTSFKNGYEISCVNCKVECLFIYFTRAIG